MKRQDVKKRPLSDTVLLNLEPESVVYRVLDGKGLYLRVKPGGQKSWELRYKRHDGKWTWLGLGSYPRVSGALARKQADELNADIAAGQCPRASRLARQFPGTPGKPKYLRMPGARMAQHAPSWLAARHG